ncbi:MAG TPA: alpha-L-fucosidase [Terriglobales bacterium]|nr:alpha-L-fucosidase [Terriglobales bacterium]
MDSGDFPIALDRRRFLAASAAALAAAALPQRSFAGAPALPLPSPQQLAWQRDQRAMFVHFGINTFTNREWGTGAESPALFHPAALDPHQWAQAARASGFRAMILTAKHHDGFCLWPSRLTTHSVAASPWRQGKGDVVREFVHACRQAGLGAGLYLSPWDRHEPSYGSPRYNDFYCGQLTELLTHYGPLQEVWFDGANGEGPKGKKQVYDWPRYWALVRRLQPQALMFSDAGPDLRWIGNERGLAGDPDWSAVDPAVVPFPGASGPAVTAMLQHGDPQGSVWRPGEADVSLRPGWFYHPAEDARLKTVEELVEIYFGSVGRNAKLLLNVPPTPEGLLHHADVDRLAEFQARLQYLFDQNLAAAGKMTWRGPMGELDLASPAPVTIAALTEAVEHGQRVSAYRLEGQTLAGAWVELSRGTTIGMCKLDRFANAPPVRRLRLTLEAALAPPLPVRLAVYGT